jgi:hypothetical protein
VKVDEEITALIEALCREQKDRTWIDLDYKKLSKMITYSFFRIVKFFFADVNAGWYERGDVEKICRSVAREFERRFMDPYEQKKLEENADV